MSLDVGALIDEARGRLGVTRATLEPIEQEGLEIFAAEALSPSRRNAGAVSGALHWLQGSVDRLVHIEKLVEARSSNLQTLVTRPVFIICGARTGSTLLQHLLALAPDLRAPTLAELWLPFPTGGGEARAERRKNAKDLLRTWPAAALQLHPMAADAPEECHWILTHNPARATFQLAEAYWHWLRALDPAALRTLYESYGRQVRLFQSADPSRRWLSKTFAHAHYWPVLFDVFPDARVVRLHRDPRDSLASSCSLIQRLVPGSDPIQVGAMAIDVLEDGLKRMAAADATAPHERFVDVDYDELCRRPAEVVSRIGEALGVGAADDLGTRVSAYLGGSRRIRAARHAYVLEDFGLSEDDVTDRLAGYLSWAGRRLDFGIAAAGRPQVNPRGAKA